MQIFSLTHQPIDTGTLEKQLADPAAGALVTFHGRVRNHHQDRTVRSLEYHAHQVLAESAGQSLIADLQREHPACRLIACHRLGHLKIGEVALWVGAVSAHRSEAFAAAEACIVAIKQRLPIWKKEHYGDASEAWLEQTVLPSS